MNVHCRSTRTQEASEGDGRRQGGKVNEDDGGHALGVHGVPDVGEVLGVPPRHVLHQAAEQTARPPQGVVAGLGRVRGAWGWEGRP